MRALLLLALVPVFGLAGCLEEGADAGASADDGNQGGSQGSSVSCNNGDCTVCVDGDCADCAQDECEACRDGDCPAFDRARTEAAITGPPADVSISETHDLSLGLQETGWAFDVASGATGHVSFTARDLATKSMALSANVCLEYEVDGPNVHKEGDGAGSCTNSNNIAVSNGSTSDSPYPILVWTDLPAGRYSFSATAQPQLNELVVDIRIDNP